MAGMGIKRAFSQLDQAQPWDSHSQLLECVMVLEDTHDVKTFCFQTADNSWFRYLPGQFITVDVEIDGQRHQRCYTLSSSPTRPLSISITVKAQQDGLVSNWLHRSLKIGDRIRAYGPSGIFSFHHQPAKKYLFLSGGVGATPLLSMTRWLFDYGQHTDVVFVHCARTPSDIIARTELEAMSARLADIKLAFVCESPDPQRAWTGYSGRLNQLMLELIAPDYAEREVFCCGPEPFMQAARDILNSLHFDMAHYHEESFSAPIIDASDTPEHDDVVPDEAAPAQVSFLRSGREVSCNEGDTLLAVAKSCGLHIPNACQFGVCGTCAVKKLDGEVHMVHNGGITQEQLDEGYVLACCAHPLGAVQIDF